MLCVGLTGGIGSGKSTVAKMFAELGAMIIDADIIAREVTAVNEPGYEKILAHFGADILTAEGELDRKKLRQIIFADKKSQLIVEQILHPLIINEIKQRLTRLQAPYCIVVIPLLVEAIHKIDFLNRICVVDAPTNLRTVWAAKRDQVSALEITAIIEIQASREQRLNIADDIIVNNDSLLALKKQVMALHIQYLQKNANQA